MHKNIGRCSDRDRASNFGPPEEGSIKLLTSHPAYVERSILLPTPNLKKKKIDRGPAVKRSLSIQEVVSSIAAADHCN